MPISVNNQAYIFLCSILAGAIIAFIYDAFRIKRKAVKTVGLLVQLEDILFWVLVAVVMLTTVYYSNEGELRGYIFLGALLGIIFYSLLLSKLVMRSSLFIIKIVTTVFKGIWWVVTYPFKLIYRLLSYPAGFIYGSLKKGMRKARRIGRIRMEKARLWKRVFKNLRKKI